MSRIVMPKQEPGQTYEQWLATLTDEQLDYEEACQANGYLTYMSQTSQYSGPLNRGMADRCRYLEGLCMDERAGRDYKKREANEVKH